jgi:hypothetical protein
MSETRRAVHFILNSPEGITYCGLDPRDVKFTFDLSSVTCARCNKSLFRDPGIYRRRKGYYFCETPRSEMCPWPKRPQEESIKSAPKLPAYKRKLIGMVRKKKHSKKNSLVPELNPMIGGNGLKSPLGSLPIFGGSSAESTKPPDSEKTKESPQKP